MIDLEKYKIVDYIIATASRRGELVEEVKERINDGYVPIGGVAIDSWTIRKENKHAKDEYETGAEFGQAMVKLEKR